MNIASAGADLYDKGKRWYDFKYGETDPRDVKQGMIRNIKNGPYMLHKRYNEGILDNWLDTLLLHDRSQLIDEHDYVEKYKGFSHIDWDSFVTAYFHDDGFDPSKNYRNVMALLRVLSHQDVGPANYNWQYLWRKLREHRVKNNNVTKPLEVSHILSGYMDQFRQNWQLSDAVDDDSNIDVDTTSGGGGLPPDERVPPGMENEPDSDEEEKPHKCCLCGQKLHTTSLNISINKLRRSLGHSNL